ncbi:aldo-keto reductase family 1 member B1-like isoform X2 [Hermetia illucens]|uniref:aldo-keto reductase family 1 member B1-like isoform X2 n=1 Tax=Hermetia illucens TaxID=343691 RepID=UPI0018CC79A9|nr:aldo-keto reductase family 1 member B1-like isoform X2 [Hermetia illucens]
MEGIPKVKLNNGLEMPGFGLGTYMCKSNEGVEAVKYAIDKGYRHFDTAYAYGNENDVGTAIKEKISEGVVKREDIFVTTKLWCTYHEPSRVEDACRKSLENLGLDYIDLYLIHFPIGFVYVDDKTLIPYREGTSSILTKYDAALMVFINKLFIRLNYSDVDYLDTWKAMESLVKKGLVRSVGLSNFNAEQIERVLKNCEIKPVTNQVECSIELNQKKLIEFCRQRDIVITSYCPLGRPNPSERKPSFLFENPTKAIAEKHKKTPAQIALRYVFQLGTVPIPKSVTKSRIDENIDIFDFELSSDEMKVLDKLHTGNRAGTFVKIVDSDHPYFPFKAEF